MGQTLITDYLTLTNNLALHIYLSPAFNLSCPVHDNPSVGPQVVLALRFQHTKKVSLPVPFLWFLIPVLKWHNLVLYNKWNRLKLSWKHSFLYPRRRLENVPGLFSPAQQPSPQWSHDRHWPARCPHLSRCAWGCWISEGKMRHKWASLELPWKNRGRELTWQILFSSRVSSIINNWLSTKGSFFSCFTLLRVSWRRDTSVMMSAHLTNPVLWDWKRKSHTLSLILSFLAGSMRNCRQLFIILAAGERGRCPLVWQ